MEKISIIVPSHNNLDYLKLLIPSIREHQHAEHELLVLDDFSDDGTENWLKKNGKKWGITYYRIDDKKTGICRAVETLVEKTTNDIILYLHSDMVVGKNFDINMYKHLKPKTIVSATRIEPPLYNKEPYKIHYNCGTYPNQFEKKLFNSVVKEYAKDEITEGIFVPYMFYKKDWIGYDPVFYPATREDSDKFNRWKEAGMNFITSKDSLVYHFSGRGGRHLKAITKDEEQWKKQERKNLKNFIRKWKSVPVNDPNMNPIILPRSSNISCFVLLGNEGDLVYNFLENIEPYFEEIVFIDDNSIDNSIDEINRYIKNIETLKPTNFKKEKIKIIKRALNNDFGAQCNFAMENCMYDWCFKADIDEIFSSELLNGLHQITYNLDRSASLIETMGFARINTIDDVMVNDIPRNIWFTKEMQKYKDNKSFNNKDYQFRLFKKPCKIVNKVHEIPECVMKGEKNKATLSDRMLIYHHKSSERQKRQDGFYSKILEERKKFNKVLFDSVLYTTEGITRHAREEILQLKDKGFQIQLLSPYKHNINIENVEMFRDMYYPIDLEKDNYITIINQPPVRWKDSFSSKTNNQFGYLAFEGKLPDDWVGMINESPIRMLMTPSEYCKQNFIESGVQKPIEVVPHGIDPAKFNSERYAKTKKFDKFTFLWAGTAHNERKGLDVAVKAFCEAFGNDDSVQLILKVNKVYNPTQNVDRLVHKYMTKPVNNIKIIDEEMNDEEMRELIAKSNVFLSTSRSEGFGIILLEAMALGVPVIATDAGGNREFCKGNCKFIPVKEEKYAPWLYPYYKSKWYEYDIDDIKKAMVDEINTEYGKDYSKKISDRIRKEYAWSTIVDDMLEKIKKYM